ncbi:MAG: hypothetical protein LC104_18745 [Bacteroidales bacterium]|nr:hypothetical protein [Bacteroidales bacterium]
MYRISTPTLLLLILSAGGCSDQPNLVPVSGTLTLDGKPLPHKAIRYIPEPGTPGLGGGRNSDAEGRYTILAQLGGQTKDFLGLPPGQYRVVIAEPQIPMTSPVPETDADGSPAAAIAPEAVDPRRRKSASIPVRYTQEETTDLRITVPPEGGVFDLKLTTKP